MMNEVKIDRLIRSKRRTISLIISPDATLVVRAPHRTTLEYIENLVFAKRFWIEEKKKQLLKHFCLSKTKNFTEDEEFYYLGNTYKLKFFDGHKIEVSDFLFFPQIYRHSAKTKTIVWYKKKALEIITERVHYFSKIAGWKFQSLTLSNAKRQWGSCKSNGKINFNWKLIMAPLAVIDYVVVHELAHLVEHNHSKKFWRKVESILPDYKTRQKWLKENANKFTI